jgi:hypothetical protein
MGVAFVPIVHNSGSHGEAQNLGLTPPNHGQTLGDKARAGANYRVADDTPGVNQRHIRARLRATLLPQLGPRLNCVSHLRSAIYPFVVPAANAAYNLLFRGFTRCPYWRLDY